MSQPSTELLLEKAERTLSRVIEQAQENPDKIGSIQKSATSYVKKLNRKLDYDNLSSKEKTCIIKINALLDSLCSLSKNKKLTERLRPISYCLLAEKTRKRSRRGSNKDSSSVSPDNCVLFTTRTIRAYARSRGIKLGRNIRTKEQMCNYIQNFD